MLLEIEDAATVPLRAALSRNGARAIPVYRDTGMYIYIRKTKYFLCELLNSDSTIEFYACENIPLHRVRAHSAVE